MRECEDKKRRWEETEKQMEVNAFKVKQLVDLNVGMLYSLFHSYYVIITPIVIVIRHHYRFLRFANMNFLNRRGIFLHLKSIVTEIQRLLF